MEGYLNIERISSAECVRLFTHVGIEDTMFPLILESIELEFHMFVLSRKVSTTNVLEVSNLHFFVSWS